MKKKQSNQNTKSLENNHLASYISSCKKSFYFCLFFSFFISIFTLSSSIYSMQVLDRVLSSGSFETLLYLTIITLMFLVFLGILIQVRAMIFVYVANLLDEKLSPILLSCNIESNKRAKINSQNIKDLQIVKNFISSPVFTTLLDIPFAIIYLIIIFFIHWINGFITLIAAFIMLKIAYINEKSTKDLIKESNQTQLNSIQEFEIISSNAELINAIGMRKTMLENWRCINNFSRKISTNLSTINNRISSISKILKMAIQTITMASSTVLVIKNKMSSGGIIATSILAGKALAPFDNIINLWKSIKTTKEAYFRLEESIKDYSIDKNKIELPELKGEIFIDKLVYKHQDSNQFLIKGISLKIKQGEIVAIIGENGSGKTTLAKLLVGYLKPNSGVITFDGANIFEQDLEKIGKYIGYLPQDVKLFKGSVKHNISRMNLNVLDKEIIKSALFCNIHNHILSLQNGYETIIDQNACNLSAGQRQKIALARTYFGDVRLAILDEPNSNLDFEGEVSLNNIILKSKEQKITTIIITHKPSILSICDKIILLHSGEIKEVEKNFFENKKLTTYENRK